MQKEDQNGLLSYNGQHLKVPNLPGNYGTFYLLLADAIRQNKPLPVLPEDALQVIQLIEKARGIAADIGFPIATLL